MQLTVGKKTLKLNFSYSAQPEELDLGQLVTNCEVIEVGEGSAEFLVGSSAVRKHPKQNHCKFLARRNALARALRMCPRAERTEIWKAYLGIVRIPK